MNWYDIARSGDGKVQVVTADRQQAPPRHGTSGYRNHWVSLETYVSDDHGMTWTVDDPPRIVFFGRHRGAVLSSLKTRNRQITDGFGNGGVYVPGIGQCRIRRNVVLDPCGREVGHAGSNLDLYTVNPSSVRTVTKFEFILGTRRVCQSQTHT